MALEIRTAELSQANLVHQIVKAGFAEYIGKLPVSTSAEQETLEQVEQTLRKTGNAAILVWDNEKAVGTARYELRPEYMYVGRVAILPEYKGKGIGTLVMNYLESLAIELGKTGLKLGTRLSIKRNLSFYQRLGYQIEETEPHPRGNDTVVWFVKQL